METSYDLVVKMISGYNFESFKTEKEAIIKRDIILRKIVKGVMFKWDVDDNCTIFINPINVEYVNIQHQPIYDILI